MDDPQLKRVVVHTADMDKAFEFWLHAGLCLGQGFLESGPMYLVSNMNGVVFEVHPSESAIDLDKSTRLGFSIPNLAGTIEQLRSINAEIIQEPQRTPSGLRATVRDPDGRTVELYQGSTGEAARRIDGETIVKHFGSDIHNLYRHPAGYVGSADDYHALDCVLSTMHISWAVAVGRVSEYHDARRQATDEELEAMNFETWFRLQNPAASDKETAEYVLSCWKKVTQLLGITDQYQ